MDVLFVLNIRAVIDWALILLLPTFIYVYVLDKP